MDFSKLDQNEKLAVYGAAALVIAGLISAYGGLMWLGILAAIAMLAVVFLPQLSPSTNLPGSKGTLMATLGFIAAAAAVITLLQWIQYFGALLGGAMFSTILLLVATAGAAVMAWAGWQELQKEGGRWQFGSTTGSGSATAGGTTAATTTSAAPPAATDADAYGTPPRTTDPEPLDDRPRDV